MAKGAITAADSWQDFTYCSALCLCKGTIRSVISNFLKTFSIYSIYYSSLHLIFFRLTVFVIKLTCLRILHCPISLKWSYLCVQWSCASGTSFTPFNNHLAGCQAGEKIKLHLIRKDGWIALAPYIARILDNSGLLNKKDEILLRADQRNQE